MSEKKNYYTTEEEIIRMQNELDLAHDLSLDRKNTYTWKKVFKMVSSVLSVVIICLLFKTWFDVMDAKSRGEVPTVFGYQIYEVQTGSMDPTLPVKSLILSKKVENPNNLEKGDIITFINGDGVTVTHRIIEVVNTNGEIGYRTKGDNAENSIDPEILKPHQVKALYKVKLPFRLPESEALGGEEDE